MLDYKKYLAITIPSLSSLLHMQELLKCAALIYLCCYDYRVQRHYVYLEEDLWCRPYWSAHLIGVLKHLVHYMHRRQHTLYILCALDIDIGGTLIRQEALQTVQQGVPAQLYFKVLLHRFIPLLLHRCASSRINLN